MYPFTGPHPLVTSRFVRETRLRQGKGLVSKDCVGTSKTGINKEKSFGTLCQRVPAKVCLDYGVTNDGLRMMYGCVDERGKRDQKDAIYMIIVVSRGLIGRQLPDCFKVSCFLLRFLLTPAKRHRLDSIDLIRVVGP